MSVLSAPIFFYNSTSSLPSQFNFVSILAMAGSVILTFFTAWNWFLVFNGNTTIEYWSARAGFQSDNSINDFSLNSIGENIYMVFGTKNILSAIFIPSLIKLPFSGLEWSRLLDCNFRVKFLEGDGKYYHDEIIQSVENELMKDLEI